MVFELKELNHDTNRAENLLVIRDKQHPLTDLSQGASVDNVMHIPFLSTPPMNKPCGFLFWILPPMPRLASSSIK
jgi:hypothetical protein